MMNFLVILSCILFNEVLSINEFEGVSINSTKEYVKIGENVQFTCIRNDKFKRSQHFRIKRGSDSMSENCALFVNKTYYSIDCVDEKYIFTIKKFRYEDIKKWSCSYLNHYGWLVFKAYEPGEINLYIKTFAKVGKSDFLKPKMQPKGQIAYININGRGTKSSPFDLRKNDFNDIVCSTKCSYPDLRHKVVLNSGNVSIEFNTTTLSKEKCGKGKYSSKTKASFNCKKWNLKGIVEINFFSVYPESTFTVSHKSVYVLCPTEPIKWWMLTYDEKVITGIGCVIGLALILTLFLLVCRWRSHQYKDLDECHIVSRPEKGTQNIRGYRV